MPGCGRADIPGHSAFCFTSLLQVCSWWAAEPEKRHDGSIPAGASGTKISLLQTLAAGRLTVVKTITAEPKLCRQVIRQAN